MTSLSTWFLAILFVLYGSVNGVEVRVSFGTQTVATPPNWNSVDMKNTPLNSFSDGSPSGISVTWDGVSGIIGTGTNGIYPEVDWVTTTSAAGVVFRFATITFSGVPAGVYTVELVSARSSAVHANQFFRVQGAAPDSTFRGNTADPFASTDGQNNNDFLIFENVVSAGSIVVSLAPGSSTPLVNAMRISGSALPPILISSTE
jgi:hypothetical protein